MRTTEIGDYRFGPFRLDSAGFRLWRNEAPVQLSPKALDLLFLLVQKPAALLSKETIQQNLWPDVAVTDNALTQIISDLRQALGDSAAAPRYIQTVARRGYRFIAPVEVIPDPPPRLPEYRDAGFAQFVRGLDTSVAGAPRAGARETSNLEAYRVFTEGRIKLEALDPAQVPSAIVDFNRAISLDPRYALAYVGRAHARFWRYEASRARNRPDTAELRAAVADSQRAIELAPDLSEAYAALALFLVSANQPAAALAAGRRAVALEPGNWRHLFRLGVAAWGDERLRCFEGVLERYPEFAYTYFGVAMVYVARGDLGRAEEMLRRGLTLQDASVGRVDRFPGRGLHWLLGLTCLARGDPPKAHDEFDHELASPRGELYAAEYAMDAYDGHGFAFLQTGDVEAATGMFGRALEIFPDHARSLVGLAQAHGRCGRARQSASALEHAERAITELRGNSRTTEADMAVALLHMVAGRPGDAVATLERLLSDAPPGFAAWTLPIESLLAPMHQDGKFKAVLARLAERAR